MSRPYVGICSKCNKLLELDTATALCGKCSLALLKKKEGNDGG